MQMQHVVHNAARCRYRAQLLIHAPHMHHTCTAHAPHVQATVLFCENNFWGRTIAACSSSSDPSCRKGFGPFLPGNPKLQFKPYPYP